MKQKKHLHTEFLKFLIEKHSQDPDEDIEIPLPDLEEEENFKLRKKIPLKPIDIEEEEDEETQDEEEDDEIIETLLSQYKNLKTQYENNKIRFRK